MASQTRVGAAPDRVAAWPTGTGIGLLVLMLVWILGNRLTGLVWEPPVGPVIAYTFAIALGIASALMMGRRLLGSLADGDNSQSEM